MALSQAERQAIGALWQHNALYEHASVASFAVFLLQAMQLGAPPAILQRTIAAMDDEVRHAMLCFALANRFLGVAQQPGPFAQPIAPAAAMDVQTIVEAVIAEGCISETIAVAFAAQALCRAEDAEVKACLETIVAEERRHSDLAWDFVTWVRDTYPAMAAPISAAFERSLSDRVVEVDIAGWCPAAERFGHLPADARCRIRAEVIACDLIPRARALGIGVAIAA